MTHGKEVNSPTRFPCPSLACTKKPLNCGPDADDLLRVRVTLSPASTDVEDNPNSNGDEEVCPGVLWPDGFKLEQALDGAPLDVASDLWTAKATSKARKAAAENNHGRMMNPD